MSLPTMYDGVLANQCRAARRAHGLNALAQCSALPRPPHPPPQIWLGLGTANANFLYASNLLLAGVVLCHIRALLLQALRRCSPTHAQTQKSLLQQPAPGTVPPGEGAGRRLHKHALRK